MKSRRAVGAIDIGGTKIAVGVVDEAGQLLARTEGPTTPEEGYPAALQRTKFMLRELSERCHQDIVGIGVSSTGPIDPQTGVFGDVGTLPGWKGSPLGHDLAREFGLPVAIENDADAAALGEFAWGAGRGSTNFIYVTISTGIGAGIILNGHLYRGAGCAHPEIGHQVIDAGGPLCYCRARGCWESLASGPAMEAWVRDQAAAAQLDGADLSARGICALARQGNALALQAVEREARYLGLGLANLVTMFCPERIALGGGLMQSADLFLPAAKALVSEICTQVPAANTTILTATLGQDAGLAGAARVWHHRFCDSSL